MPTTFHTPKNHVSTTITASRSAGAAVLEVADGSVFGAAFPLIVTAVRGSAVLCILEITGRVGNTLTVSGAIEGTTDAALVAGDRIEMRPTALALTEVQDAVHALETGFTDLVAMEAITVSTTGSYADPAWIASLAGTKISGDITGNAASITGAIAEGQVTGLTAALADKASLAGATFAGNVLVPYLQSSGGIVANIFSIAGANSCFLVSRRDTGVGAYQVLSLAGELSFYSLTTNAVVASIGAAGVLSGDGSGLTGVVHTTGNETISGPLTLHANLSVSQDIAAADTIQYAVASTQTDSSTADSSASFSFPVMASFTKTGTSHVAGYNRGCYLGQAQVQAGSVSVLDVYLARGDVSAGAAVADLCHYKADSAYTTAGTVTNRYGFQVNDFAPGPCANQYGLHVNPLTSGTTLNYAVYTAGTTPSYFGGPVTAAGGISGDGSGLSGVVHSTGDEIVAGTKTFSGAVVLSLAPQLPTLADAAAPDNSLFFGSDHLDGSGHARLCRKQGGTTTPIG